jgi:hypothetical protein
LNKAAWTRSSKRSMARNALSTESTQLPTNVRRLRWCGLVFSIGQCWTAFARESPKLDL